MNQTTNDYLIKRRLRLEQKKKESERLFSKYKYTPSPQPQKIQKSVNVAKREANVLPKIVIPTKKQYNVTLIKKKNVEKKEPSIENINQITFSKYLQMQTLAEMSIKPGRNMTDKLLKHIDKISIIRKKVMEKEIEQILALKGRYNDEYPDEDTKIDLEDKGLIQHKWKNSFYLSEYQNFFLDELKGKISSLNYRIMLKKFRQISRMCFSKGAVNLGNINNMLSQEY